MTQFLATLVMGLIIIALGIINMMGNISTLHSYHRSRVSPEDVRPFGKLVGIGTVIIGACCILLGAANFISEKTGSGVYSIVGTVIMIIGVVIGMCITFYAMKKYNGGVF